MSFTLEMPGFVTGCKFACWLVEAGREEALWAVHFLRQNLESEILVFVAVDNTELQNSKVINLNIYPTVWLCRLNEIIQVTHSKCFLSSYLT